MSDLTSVFIPATEFELLEHNAIMKRSPQRNANKKFGIFRD